MKMSFRKYKPVESKFQNGLLVAVWKAVDTEDISVHLVRTSNPEIYTRCAIRVTSVTEWNQIREILAQVKDSRQSHEHFTQPCGTKGFFNVAWVPNIGAGEGYLTTLSICKWHDLPDTVEVHALPLYNPKKTKAKVTPPKRKRNKRNTRETCNEGEDSNSDSDGPSYIETAPISTSTRPFIESNTYNKEKRFHDICSIVLEDMHLDFILDNVRLSKL